jgi:hypothetical protein
MWRQFHQVCASWPALEVLRGSTDAFLEVQALGSPQGKASDAAEPFDPKGQSCPADVNDVPQVWRKRGNSQCQVWTTSEVYQQALSNEP